MCYRHKQSIFSVKSVQRLCFFTQIVHLTKYRDFIVLSVIEKMVFKIQQSIKNYCQLKYLHSTIIYK